MDSKDDKTLKTTPSSVKDKSAAPLELINASGHAQELERNFSLLSLAGVGIVVGNVWPAVGGSILVALYNGGAPGEADQSLQPSLQLTLI